MKRLISIVVLLITFSGSALANVNVVGRASILVIPDQVRITVGVETRTKTLSAARKKNDKKIAAILKVLKANGVAKEDIQLDHIRINPVFNNYNSVTLKGYTIQKNITFCVKKIDSFEHIMSYVLQAGANNVSGIQFETNQLEQLQIKARKKAVQAAKEKASYLANELGLKIGRAVSIQDMSRARNLPEFNRVYERKAFSASDTSTFSIGQIEVTAEVHVGFILEES